MTPQALKMFTVPEIIVITRFIQTNKNNCNIASRLIFTKAGKQLPDVYDIQNRGRRLKKKKKKTWESFNHLSILSLIKCTLTIFSSFFANDFSHGRRVLIY